MIGNLFRTVRIYPIRLLGNILRRGPWEYCIHEDEPAMRRAAEGGFEYRKPTYYELQRWRRDHDGWIEWE
jgi:hypothetical protein